MDLFVANIDQEITLCLRALAWPTRRMSGWGLKFFDYDSDGNLDPMIANGFPDDLVEEFSQPGHL